MGPFSSVVILPRGTTNNENIFVFLVFFAAKHFQIRRACVAFGSKIVVGAVQRYNAWMVFYGSSARRLGTDVLGCVLLLLTVIFPVAPVRAASAAAPANVPLADEGVLLYEGIVVLPTYPVERYQTAVIDPQYNWPYLQFDYERFLREAPAPQPRAYRTIILENEYLRMTILPELGGRLWRVVHKPTGNDLFYHNSVVMPSPWGPADMRGWLAIGGLEWNLPQVEHGYAWGTPWDVASLKNNGQTATVTLSTPRDGRTLGATVAIGLQAGEAAFTVDQTIANLSEDPVRFSYWNSAALAPGKANRPSAETHFVAPTAAVVVHSSDDTQLPGAGHTIPWPVVKGRDLSRLGNWNQYLGFFEQPAAHGPFVGVYDRTQDAGAVRVFPADVARGSKIFGLGWQHALDPSIYTTDHSAYVELHGGLAPTFADQVSLPAGAAVKWQETWYPVAGIGDLVVANANGALNWARVGDGLRVGIYPTRPLRATLVVSAGDDEVARWPVQARPDAPFDQVVPLASLPASALTLRLEDSDGALLLGTHTPALTQK